MRGAAAGVVLLAAVLVSGCSAGQSQELKAGSGPAGGSKVDERAWPARTPVSGLTKGMVLPIEGYLISYPETVAWQRAQQSLWKRCMQRYGFTSFDPPEPGMFPPPGYDDANMARRYGISDSKEAARYGYHLPGGMGEPPVWEPGEGAERAVFSGSGVQVRSGSYKGEKVPENGCQGEVKGKLGRISYALASKVEFASLEESRNVPAVRSAVAVWSSCMKSHGYRAEHPYKAPDLISTLGSENPSAAETALAVADVGCKKTSRLVDVWFGAEEKIQKRRIEENQLALDEERKKNDAVLKTASRANDY
ncbi:hypothetical protein [Streptomyces sp. NBC_01022]|uniref:hypothetical protein n=1 Tax=Streptomyces sp. NBC_01022 TaxID=2903723 RepID=UPI002DD81B3C|nr:hypothetical protein [Streptomyces sp. NBC_01022]WRZ83470.1 hypothetical protein OG316_26070 [Streptomyces sp. NBC_01022]